jgi:hypothetical protein
MTGRGKSDDPVVQLGNRIASLEAAVRDLQRPQPLRVPVFATDPPESDPVSMWLFPDGRLRARHLNPAGTAYVYREWVPTSPGGTTSGTAAAAAAPAPISRTSVWGAQWSQSYRQTGAQRTDWSDRMYYGNVGDGFNGRNRSLIGFDYAGIAAALSGSTITGVWIDMTNIHSYWNNGSDIFFGIHNFTAKPGTWAGGGIPSSMIFSSHWGKPQRKQQGLPLVFAQAIRDGWGKGIALEAPSNSLAQYGFAAGFGSGYPLNLTITYVK